MVSSDCHGCLTRLLLPGACRVNFRLKSDTSLFEIVKCKTSVSTIEVHTGSYASVFYKWIL